MALSVEELVKRIEQGEDLESISRSLISPAERGLLKCCAIVRTFNEFLVDNYFRRHVPDSGSIPFSQLIGRAFVHRVPRSDGEYFLQPLVQKQYYDAWWEAPEGVVGPPKSEVPRKLGELAANLAEYYAAQGEAAKLDLLAQQVFIDTRAAWALFEELYKAADDAFDLARCRDIINVLTGRENVLVSFSRSLNDTDRYRESRTLWATEYYQTVSYYEREELKDELESFFAHSVELDYPNKKWILHLHAPGGMGKTMFVRWLISRRCVPKPYTIPCARVDFDFVDRITSSQHRWRLFLNMARDLEVQIPGNYFRSLITKFSEYETILSHAETQTDSPTPAQIPPPDKLEDEIRFLFGKALGDAHLDPALDNSGLVVLILDTLEEVILYHPDDLLELVRQIEEIRKLAPRVLLVLSGRYDLTAKEQAKLPQFSEQFGAVTQTVRVKPFSKDEALGFLQEKKGLTKDRPLEMVVQRSEGNPFKLALFASILIDNPEITADTIRDYPSADLLYLIERVLARIPNKKLHWLLRYGVVPRKLTRAFAEEVIKKHLLLRITGESSHDDPHRYGSLTEKIHETVRQKRIFEVQDAPAQDINMDELWTDLQNYASSYAWVTTEPSDPNTVVFHGDVVNPMRRWLESEPVYKLLHEDAIRYFENKAKEDPNEWAKWMGNAVYHRFQLEGAGAAAYWSGLLGREANPRRRRDLASEVIGSEYVDDNLKPRRLLNGEEIIGVSTLIQAYYWLAQSTIDIARSENLAASNPLWTEADYDLQKCEQLQKQYSEDVVSAGDIAAMRAAILTSQNHGEQAIALIEDVLKKKAGDEEQLLLRLELANAQASLGKYQEAQSQWKASLDLANRVRTVPLVFVGIYRRLARLHRDQGDLELSAHELEEALGYLTPPESQIKYDLLLELADAYFDMGQFNRGKETIEKTRALLVSVASVNLLRYSNYLVKFSLASEDWYGAYIRSTRTEAEASTPAAAQSIPNESRGLFDSLVVESQELLGMAQRQLFNVEETREAFETARSRWREIGNSKAAQRCMLKKAEMWLSVVGDIRETASTLNEAARLTVQYDAEQTCETMLLSLKQFHLMHDESWVTGGIEALEKESIDKGWNAKLRAKSFVAIGALRLSVDDTKATNEFFAELAEKLEQVKPVSARMILLDPLKEYPTCSNVGWKVAEELLSLVPLKPNDQDFYINAPKLAELLRVLGRKDAALSLLNNLLERHSEEGNTLSMRNLWMIRGRTAYDKDSPVELNQIVDGFLDDFKTYELLCAATLVEFAELRYTTNSTSVRLKLLERAEGLLRGKASESQWMPRLIAARAKLTIKDDRKEALEQIESAKTLYNYLGNNRAIQELNDFIAEQEPVPETRTGGEAVTKGLWSPNINAVVTPRAVTIHVEDNWTESVKIRTTIPDEKEVKREIPIEPETLIDRLLAFDTYENYSFSFLKQMTENWILTCTQMGPLLIDNKSADYLQRPSKEKTVLCLMIDALQLSSPPWEMMVMPSGSDVAASLAPGVSHFYRSLGPKPSRTSDTAWLQAGLSRVGNEGIVADGMFDRKTQQALVRFQREHDLPAHGHFDGKTRRKLKEVLRSELTLPGPRVLLLRPGIDRQRAASRGLEVFGLSAEDIYKQEKFGEVKVLEDPNMKEVEKHIQSFMPDVIHIFSTVEESSSIGIYLDFATGGTGVLPSQSRRQVKGSPSVRGDLPLESVPYLTLSALTEMMRKYQKRGRARPLLILDVLEPPGRTDLFTQLFLRNAFAAQLYQRGNFESIIATGLTSSDMQEKATRTLVSGLGAFDSVGEIVDRLRRLSDLGNYTHLPDVHGMRGPMRDYSDRGYLGRVVSTAGIALFTQDPEG